MKHIVVCWIAAASFAAIAASSAPPGWSSPWGSYYDVISKVSRGILVEQLPDSKIKKELLGALSELIVGKVTIIPLQPGTHVVKEVEMWDDSRPPTMLRIRRH